MAKNIVEDESYILYSNKAVRWESVLDDNLTKLQASDIYSPEVPEYLRFSYDLIKYLEQKNLNYRSDGLVQSGLDYQDMAKIAGIAYDLAYDFGVNYNVAYQEIKRLLGDDLDNFIRFREAMHQQAIEKITQDLKSEQSEQIIAENPRIVSENYLHKRIIAERHYEILTNNPELQVLIHSENRDKLKTIENFLNTHQGGNDLNQTQQNMGVLDALDKAIWSEEIEYQYELMLLEKQMQKSGVNSIINVFFPDDLSKTTKSAIKEMKKANKKTGVDKRLLTETIRSLTEYLKAPNTHNLTELNTSISKFPQQSPIILYLQSLLALLCFLTLAAIAVTLCIKFGVPVESTFNGIIGSIVNFGNQSAFVLPTIEGGYSVPIWYLVVGALAGALIGIAGVKAAKSMATDGHLFSKPRSETTNNDAENLSDESEKQRYQNQLFPQITEDQNTQNKNHNDTDSGYTHS